MSTIQYNVRIEIMSMHISNCYANKSNKYLLSWFCFHNSCVFHFCSMGEWVYDEWGAFSTLFCPIYKYRRPLNSQNSLVHTDTDYNKFCDVFIVFSSLQHYANNFLHTVYYCKVNSLNFVHHTTMPESMNCVLYLYLILWERKRGGEGRQFYAQCSRWQNKLKICSIAIRFSRDHTFPFTHSIPSHTPRTTYVCVSKCMQFISIREFVLCSG